jgi:putative endonuclease
VCAHNLCLGKIGEDLAVGLLKKNGYRILERNYKIKLGEIDIIAEDKGTLVFVEVKTRQSDRCGLPLESVVKHKQRQITKVALAFLKEKKFLDKFARFDVVSVLYSSCGGHKLELIKNAFEMEEN